jgi:hypothetical protein
MLYLLTKGRAGGYTIAQAVSCWLPTTAAWVWSHEICGAQSGAGAGFLWVLQFPLAIFIPPTAPQSPSSIIWDWYNRPVVAAVPSRLNLIPLRIIKRIKLPTHIWILYNTDHLNSNFNSSIWNYCLQIHFLNIRQKYSLPFKLYFVSSSLWHFLSSLICVH